MPSPARQPSSSSPSVAFPTVEREVGKLTLSSSTPGQASDGSPLRLPMPRSGSMALKSPNLTPNRQQGPSSRTMAILMRSAAKVHRLAIESKIIDAGFDILAQRAEHWHTPQDDDFLSEFLAPEPRVATGADPMQKWVPRLTAGAIHVLVLERNNAASTWLNLLGPDSGFRSRSHGEKADDDDDDDDHDDADLFEIGEDGLPTARSGLRKTYGPDAFYGSANEEVAEAQIAICFPELSRLEPADHLSDDRSASPSVEVQGRRALRDSDASLNARSDVSPSGPSSQRSNSDAAKEFRARPMPSTTRRASIQPRMSKAAALRMGIQLPEPRRRRTSDDSSTLVEAPIGISGVAKAQVPLPASLRPPTIAPRLNKAAAARTKSDGAATSSPGVVREKKEVDYSNTPGHKRLSVIAVASTAAPAIAPRQTRASMGRISAYGGAGGTATSSPGSGPASVRRDEPALAKRRASSIASLESGHSSTCASTSARSTVERERKPVDYTNIPGHKRQSLSLNIPSLAAPAVAPRANRASLARTGSGSGNGNGEGASVAPVGRPSSSLSTARAPQRPSSSSAKTSSPRGDPAELYANTPGHKRKSMSFQLASLQAPTIAPRSNTAANARLYAQSGSTGAIPSAKGVRPGSSLASRGNTSAAAPHQDVALPRTRAPHVQS